MNELDLYTLDQKSYSFQDIIGQPPPRFLGGLRDVISVKDKQFGAVGDGVTNDAAAFQAAINAAAVMGSAVYVPMPTLSTNYYMGSTGLTMSSVVRLYGDHKVPLVWDAAYNGTLITATGSYNLLENLILFKPKSVGAPNAAIIGIDFQGPFNVVRNVRTDQTSAGNNSGITTGIKIGGISCSIERGEFYSYDIGILYNAGGSRNDLTISDTVSVAQATAAFKSIGASTVQAFGCDFESTGLYCVWNNTTNVDSEGCVFSGYFQGGTDSGFFLDGTAGFEIRGFKIQGTVTTSGTNAVRASNTVGLSVRGASLTGATNYLKFENTNAAVDVGGNYKSGALSISGTLTPDFLPSVQSWTPTLNAFTIVNGTGGITATATITRVGNLIFWEVIINGTGTATIASTRNVSNITGLPAAVARFNNGLVQNASVSFLENTASVQGATIFTPTWAAYTPSTAGTIQVSGWFDA